MRFYFLISFFIIRTISGNFSIWKCPFICLYTMIFACFSLRAYFSACIGGTITSFFEKRSVSLRAFFSRSERSFLSVNPPTVSSPGSELELSNGGHTRYTDPIFFGNLCSDRYFARKIPPRDPPNQNNTVSQMWNMPLKMDFPIRILRIL